MLEHPSMGDTDGMQAPLSDSALPWAHASHRSDEPMEEEGEEQEHSERQTAHWRRRRNEQRHRTLVEQDAERAGEGTDIAAPAADHEFQQNDFHTTFIESPLEQNRSRGVGLQSGSTNPVKPS